MTEKSINIAILALTERKATRGNEQVTRSREQIRANFTAMTEDEQKGFFKSLMTNALSLPVTTDEKAIDKVIAENEERSGRYKNKAPLNRMKVQSVMWKAYCKKIMKGVDANFQHIGNLLVALQPECSALGDEYFKTLCYAYGGQTKYGRFPYRVMTRDQVLGVLSAQSKALYRIMEVLAECKAENMIVDIKDNNYEEAPCKIPERVINKYKAAVQGTSEDKFAKKLAAAESAIDKAAVVENMTIEEAIAIGTCLPPSYFLLFKELAQGGKYVRNENLSDVVKTYMDMWNTLNDLYPQIQVYNVNIVDKVTLNAAFRETTQFLKWFSDTLRRECNGGGQQLGANEAREFTVDLSLYTERNLAEETAELKKQIKSARERKKAQPVIKGNNQGPKRAWNANSRLQWAQAYDPAAVEEFVGEEGLGYIDKKDSFTSYAALAELSGVNIPPGFYPTAVKK